MIDTEIGIVLTEGAYEIVSTSFSMEAFLLFDTPLETACFHSEQQEPFRLVFLYSQYGDLNFNALRCLNTLVTKMCKFIISTNLIPF